MAEVNHYDLGDRLKLTAQFSNEDYDPEDPTTVTCKIKKPDTEVESYVYLTDIEVVRDGIGSYYMFYSPQTAGRYVQRWEGTGLVEAAEEREFYVKEGSF